MMDEKTKLLALAHLKSKKTPREVSEILNISYSQALSLNKKLQKAERQGNVLDLFKLEEAALESLLDSVRKELKPATEILVGEVNPLVAQAVDKVATAVTGAAALEQDLTESARNIVTRLEAHVKTAQSAEELNTLATIITKINDSFFAKGTNVQVNNVSGGFEKYLKD